MCSKFGPSQVHLNEHHRLTWTVKRNELLRNEFEIRSSFITNSKIGLACDYQWTCCLVRSLGKGPLKFEIGLAQKPIDLKEMAVSFSVQVLDKSESSTHVNVVEQKWTCKLINEANMSMLGFIRDDSINIDILIKLEPPKYISVDEILDKFQPKFTEKQQSDFANLLTASALPQADSKTVIVCKGHGKTFPVNRGMLAARSNVFLHMFQSKMKEDISGIVEVSDVSSEVMQIILHFLYTGKLLENWNTVGLHEVLYAAAKYEVHDLIEFLDVAVGHICTMDNVGKVISLARKLNMKRVERNLLAFIKNSSETFDQFEKIMEDAKSDLVLEEILLATIFG